MIGRRVWSAAALVSVVVAIALAVAAAVGHFPDGLSVLACAATAVCAAWYGIRRRGVARSLGLLAAALLVCGAVVLVIVENRLLEDLLVLAAIALALVAARMAFRVHARLPRAVRPAHAVLFFNPLSGGGKAVRFHLADEARRRGIEPIELRRASSAR